MDKIFEKFIQNADEIRETWQIVEFFENEFARFKSEVGESQNDVLRSQESLKKIRSQYAELQENVKREKEELSKLKEQNAQLKDSVQIKDSIDNLRKNIPVRPLEKVDIRLQDGIVVKANPASDVYSQEIVEKYVTSLRELKDMKTKLMDKDLEIAKLRNEINDIKLERKMI